MKCNPIRRQNNPILTAGTRFFKFIDNKNNPHPLDLWNFTIAVNLTGTFNLTRLVLKHLVHVPPEDGPDGERGVVILVSSAAAVSPIIA